MSLFLRLLEKGISYGQLTVITPDQKPHKFGNEGPKVTWILNDNQTLNRISRNWEFELGETYINNGWDIADGTLYDLLAILRSNFSKPNPGLLMKPLLGLLAMQRQWNSLRSSLANVASHYDLDAALFRDFLDQELNYSCAYHQFESMSLEAAQLAKSKFLASKLVLKPGNRILDIGCGWGSLALHLAKYHDVKVTGITLSEEQLKVATDRARDSGLKDRVQFKLQDYRDESDVYDRIVSVGMFEHVGRPNYQTFFDQVANCLTSDGVALIHTIGRSNTSAPTNPWINKYVFPGGFLPSLSDIMIPVENSVLMTTDVEILRQHYNQTLSIWKQRFLAQRDKFVELKGEKFCRIWDFYLNISEVVFTHADAVVFQVQLSKQHGIVPNTRDYLYNPQNATDHVGASGETVRQESAGTSQ